MLVLGIDTASKTGSIALVECDSASSRTPVIVPLEGGTFSAQLVPQISRLLESRSLRKQDLGALAVATGPGSFTGLRVGLAAVKGLAEILAKPIAAVSWLEALARSSGQEGSVLAVLDAGRNEFYCGEYEISGSTVHLLKQELLKAEELLVSRGAIPMVTSDKTLAALAVAHELPVIQLETLRADVIARIGFLKIQAGEATPVEALDANYIRRSDAEVKRTSPPG